MAEGAHPKHVPDMLEDSVGPDESSDYVPQSHSSRANDITLSGKSSASGRKVAGAKIKSEPVAREELTELANEAKEEKRELSSIKKRVQVWTDAENKLMIEHWKKYGQSRYDLLREQLPHRDIRALRSHLRDVLAPDCITPEQRPVSDEERWFLHEKIGDYIVNGEIAWGKLREDFRAKFGYGRSKSVLKGQLIRVRRQPPPDPSLSKAPKTSPQMPTPAAYPLSSTPGPRPSESFVDQIVSSPELMQEIRRRLTSSSATPSSLSQPELLATTFINALQSLSSQLPQLPIKQEGNSSESELPALPTPIREPQTRRRPLPPILSQFRQPEKVTRPPSSPSRSSRQSGPPFMEHDALHASHLQERTSLRRDQRVEPAWAARNPPIQDSISYPSDGKIPSAPHPASTKKDSKIATYFPFKKASLFPPSSPSPSTTTRDIVHIFPTLASSPLSESPPSPPAQTVQSKSKKRLRSETAAPSTDSKSSKRRKDEPSEPLPPPSFLPDSPLKVVPLSPSTLLSPPTSPMSTGMRSLPSPLPAHRTRAYPRSSTAISLFPSPDLDDPSLTAPSLTHPLPFDDAVQHPTSPPAPAEDDFLFYDDFDFHFHGHFNL